MKTPILNLITAITFVAAFAGTTPARAEVKEVTLADQYGIHYLPMIVMKRFHLVEKHAKLEGLNDLKVKWAQFSGGSAVNTALLSGSVDFVAGGTGPFIKLWDKTTKKMPVRVVGAVSDISMVLVSNNPKFKSLKDITESDRIALPAVKVSMQAVTLQMAVAKLYGKKDYAKLDHNTVSMKHPDGMTMLLSGRSEITAHFTAPPYSTIELSKPGMHKVLSSFDVYGGPATLIVLYGGEKFRKENPKTYKAVRDALADAIDMINKDHPKVAEAYATAQKSKVDAKLVEKILADPEVRFKIAPSGLMATAKFMKSIGTISQVPSNWKQFCFPELDSQSGS